MIRPGELRERVTVQQSTSATNALGEAVLTWATFAERWAKVEGISSREALQNGQVNADISHRIRLRYLSGLTPHMRVLWRGRVLEITSVLEHYNRTEHEVLCQEAV